MPVSLQKSSWGAHLSEKYQNFFTARSYNQSKKSMILPPKLTQRKPQNVEKCERNESLFSVQNIAVTGQYISGKSSYSNLHEEA